MTADTLADRFAAQMGALLGPDFPTEIALAVSGGGDSMAMLALSHEWARHMGVRLWVVTVDHGLRSESAAEAQMVAEECRALGHPHATLRWHWDKQGNLQDAARRARIEMIDRWRQGIRHVLMAHTQDDVAETFVMRLARGSGVEGLSAMSARRHVCPHPHGSDNLPMEDVTQVGPLPPMLEGDGAPKIEDGYTIVRPLLQERRAELRHFITTLKVPYVDDPSNDDARFDRVKTRAALAELGIGTPELAATAARMARAREALGARAVEVAQHIAKTDDFGVLRLERDGFAEVERDTQLRLLAAALQWVGGQTYRPRAAALGALLDRALAGGGGTLLGAQLDVTPTHIEVFREHAALSEVRVGPNGACFWDGRWRINAPDIKDMRIRALGDDGWRQLPEQRPDTPRHGIARTLPAVFDGASLVSCPPLGVGKDAKADLISGGRHFLALLNPH